MTEAKNLKLTMLISMVYSSTMVFYSRIPSFIVMGLGILHLLIINKSIRRFFGEKETLFLCSILLVPTSTISIVGTSYSSFPLTWFHVLVLLLFFKLILSERVHKTYFCLLFIGVAYLIIISFFATDILDAAKQVLTITLFLLSFPIGASLTKKPSKNLLSVGADLYLCSAISFAFQVFFQRAFISMVGLVIGHHKITGQGRFSYAGLMGDYSFATVYLATACMILVIQFLDWGTIGLFRFFIGEVILIAATLVVTARAGLASLAIVLVVYLFRRLRRLNTKTLLLTLLGIAAVPVILNELIISRVGQSLLDPSGRLQNYSKAIRVISGHPFFGVGLGANNLYKGFEIVLPHNFFLQYLAQLGVIGLLLILMFFFEFLRKSLVKENEMKWLFWLVVISSMMIPDIFSSRFFYVIIIFCMLPKCRRHGR